LCDVVAYESLFRLELESYKAIALISVQAFASYLLERTVETPSGMAGKKAHAIYTS
jgi:hypothetical protein